jgi:hypothetical protein
MPRPCSSGVVSRLILRDTLADTPLPPPMVATKVGHGLSFSSFEYSQQHTAASSSSSSKARSLGSFHPCQAVVVTAKLALVGGPTTADEVTQLYVSIHNASVPVARHQLISFERHVFTDDQPAIVEVQFRMLPEDHAVMTGNITHNS